MEASVRWNTFVPLGVETTFLRKTSRVFRGIGRGGLDPGVRFILLTLFTLFGLAVPTARSQLPWWGDVRDVGTGVEWTREELPASRAETPAIPARATVCTPRSVQTSRATSGGTGLLCARLFRWAPFEVAGRGTVSDRRDSVACARRRQPESRGPPEEPTAA